MIVDQIIIIVGMSSRNQNYTYITVVFVTLFWVELCKCIQIFNTILVVSGAQGDKAEQWNKGEKRE